MLNPLIFAISHCSSLLEQPVTQSHASAVLLYFGLRAIFVVDPMTMKAK